MTNLDTLLAELGGLDQKLAGTAQDFPRLRQLLERRAEVIQQASASFDSIRSGTVEQRAALLRSDQAGMSLMRQLIQAKHLFSQELSQLKQEQRLWEVLAEAETAQRETGVDVSG